ncbi:TetR/AcrR family transcriptional regulator [Microbacterium sp. LMI1-1-1.1]|uniref:TetR/AcrR family transcriptional regulator n=1 Tax=Microbacterium sp. LMI1-1-1.1 TaxID=3135223 RepID=UPI003465DBCC
MATQSRSGRPRASSREVLSEAACELFLERGYHATSVSDITRRAGVSRSSFFNYFDGKADVLWGGLDQRILALTTRLRDDEEDDEHPDAAVRAAVQALAEDFRPDSLALAFGQAEAMGVVEELLREGALRQARLAAVVAERLRAAGVDGLRADVVGAAYGGAVLAAIQRWAVAGAGRTMLESLLSRALEAVPAAMPARERGSRVPGDEPGHRPSSRSDGGDPTGERATGDDAPA